MSGVPCKFGTSCSRPDCFFSHPNGRAIDATAGPSHGGQGMPMGSYAPFVPPVPFMQPYMPYVAMPPPSPSGGPKCRYDYECRRPDCFFAHPNGRALDLLPARSQKPRGNGPARPRKIEGEASPSDRDIGVNLPDSPFGVDDTERLDIEQMMDEEDRENRGKDGGDDWYPKFRDCSCCKGYIRACTALTCQSLGVCGCAFDDPDV